MGEPGEFAPTVLRGVAAKLEQQAVTLRRESVDAGGDKARESRAETLDGVAARLRARADGQRGGGA